MVIVKVLLIEEDPDICQVIQEIGMKKGWDLQCTAQPLKAIDLLKQNSYDLLICDLKLPEISGIDVLQIAKQLHPSLLFILITSAQQTEKAVSAIRLGAFQYLIKPFTAEIAETLIEKAQEHIALIQENEFLRHEVSSQHSVEKAALIAESPAMKQIMENVAKIAKSNASVFISGESGTGKEVIANAIHHLSLRAHKPFIRVNCAAIPQSLLESEFFGHEKGSFTGAIQKRLGRFELADQGTLLLDEISEIPLELQPKLLRVIQEQEFERLGGIKPIQVDVRLISTSNRNMKETVEQKLFREDLYFRLNVVPIQLPPLRERKEDILPLAGCFLEKLCRENFKERKILSESAQDKLLAYYWPGNVRELANIIERTIVMHTGDIIHAEDLLLEFACPVPVRTSTQPLQENGLTLADIEKKHILSTLQLMNHNKTQTAKKLGISIRTLRNKLKLYQLSKDTVE
jgi:two-component system, NtrC family, response regulator AtoC